MIGFLRKLETGEDDFPRRTYRKLALFLQKPPSISGNLREFTGMYSRNPVLKFPPMVDHIGWALTGVACPDVGMNERAQPYSARGYAYIYIYT